MAMGLFKVCADSIGTYQYSGIGGQMDFIRGASLSEDGKPIIAMPSTTSKGLSRIVPFLKEGAGVVTTRGHVHWVVIEYGIIDLFGRNLKQRAKALIEIAHPDHRDSLIGHTTIVLNNYFLYKKCQYTTGIAFHRPHLT